MLKITLTFFYFILSIITIVALTIVNFHKIEQIEELKTKISTKNAIIQEQDAELQELRKIIQQIKNFVLQERNILPVCEKNQRHAGCRNLAADETGATVRGARADEPN